MDGDNKNILSWLEIFFVGICGDQEGFKPPSPHLMISNTRCGGQEGSKPQSPQFMLPPDIILSASYILSHLYVDRF